MPEELVTWTSIAARMTSDRSYWVSTVTPGGAPHVAPVWGVIVDGDWYCYSERATVKARNLAVDARVAVHLADGEDVLIVHGRVADIGHPSVRPDVVDAFGAKYNRAGDQPFLPLADPAFDVLYLLRPTRAMLWRLDDYDGTQRRWRSSST